MFCLAYIKINHFTAEQVSLCALQRNIFSILYEQINSTYQHEMCTAAVRTYIRQSEREREGGKRDCN